MATVISPRPPIFEIRQRCRIWIYKDLRRRPLMLLQEAVALIANLTYEEKLALNEMLSNLEQKRPPSPAPQEITEQAC